MRDSMPGTALCPFCCGPLSIVWVHGHGQCTHCGINIDECCRGEQVQGDGAECAGSASAVALRRTVKPSPERTPPGSASTSQA